MKAIIVTEFGEPVVLKLEEVPIPEPTGTQVLVSLRAVGINPVETYIRSGNYPSKPSLPYTPGKDASGVVESVGEGVTKFKTGDRVYTADSITGTYAEFTLCDEKDLGQLPDNVTFEQGAGIWTPYATAYRALFQKAKAIIGETVLIHGASGGVGIAAIQWAKNAGLTVIGTASSDEGKRLVTEQGADHVLDHTDDSHLAAIMDVTGGKGVDVIIEMLANINLQKDFDALAMFGRIVVVGNRGSLDFNPRVIMGKDATVYGMALFNSLQPDRDQIHAAIFGGLNTGFLNPIIRKTMPLADAPLAHHEVIENKAFGKIILTP
jgi:NADPH2:quinone reductase